MKQNLLIFLSPFIFFTFYSCSGDSIENPPKSQNEINVSVKDENNNPYPKVKVKLFGGSIQKEGVTDASGAFGFDIDNSGDYEVTIIPPLTTTLITKDTIAIEVQVDVEKSINFIVETRTIDALTVVNDIDIFGEIKNAVGMKPIEPNEEIYARNAFDPPIGMLTPIKDRTGHHLTLDEWKSAIGEMDISCNGNTTKVDISLQGMIPNGTYTFWLNFLNKKKLPGELVNFGTDVVKIEPLGSGTANVKIADGDGIISANISHSSCILTEEVALVLVVVYHINGNTFGTDHIPDAEDVSHMLVYFQ